MSTTKEKAIGIINFGNSSFTAYSHAHVMEIARAYLKMRETLEWIERSEYLEDSMKDKWGILEQHRQRARYALKEEE